MITLIYCIDPSDKDQEVEWLRDQKIYPAVSMQTDWSTNQQVCKIGATVSSDQALLIKLRHKLELQADYRQR